jgi:hypothetical protein
MNKPRNWDLVIKLREEFKNHCEQFIITGGVALELYGLVKPEDVHDVDLIIIKPDHLALEKLSTLQLVSGIKDRSEYLTQLNKGLYRFELKGVEIDVFIENTVKENALWFDYVRVNPILDIFNAKKRMNRKKDWSFMIDMIKLFCTWPSEPEPSKDGVDRV